MAITVTEKPLSRESQSGDGASAQLLYSVKGTADDIAARAALVSESPASHDSQPRKNVRARPVFVDANNPDVCIWDGEVNYGVDARPDTGDSTFSFDTGGGTQHITQSLETVGAYGTHKDGTVALVTDYGGAIGVSGRNVEGCDIVVPVYNWTETHYLNDVYVTQAYRRALFWITGRINNASFRGFEPGEVLFMGASGTKRQEEDWEITFRFAASPNLIDLIVSNIAGIAKRGWEYMWVRYDDDEVGGGLVMRPLAVYVERTYNYRDFSGMGIGS